MAKNRKGILLIRGARVAEISLRRAECADILVEDGVIREIGQELPVPAGAEVFDASGLLVHPGLINAHTHSNSGLSKGVGDRWTLELLLAAGSWTRGDRLLEEKKIATQICAAEMALKGCTTAYDMYNEFPLPTLEGLDAAAEAYSEIGMRAVIAPLVADRTLYQSIPGLMDALPEHIRATLIESNREPGHVTLAILSDVLRNWKWNSDDIRAAVGPTIPLFCTDDFMCGCARLAREHGVGIQSHVGESKIQALSGIKRYGRSIVSHLDKLGLIGPDFTAAHGVWLDDDDLRILADRGASIAHNPGSNMRLGNGLFRLRRAIDLGVNVAIGTDGATCSDNQNMYESMRLASMASKTQGPDPRKWASVEEVFAAATLGSARALGYNDVGVLAPGFKADMVFLDLKTINWIPHNATINQIVHVEDGAAVRHVMVGGRMIVENGVLLGVSVEKLAEQAERARERVAAVNSGSRGAFPALEQAIVAFCPAFAKEPYAVDRYLCEEVAG